MTEKVAALFGLKAPALAKYTAKVPAVCSNPNLIMGMEIETENCKLSGGFYEGVIQRLSWRTTTDGSLRGNAFEFISNPMEMQHLIPSLHEFFTVTGFTEENYTDRCSIHVHVNCTDLSVDQLSAIALVYSIFEESMFDFVGNYRDTNIYCIPWNQCRFNTKLITNMQRHLLAVPKGWQKYTAVNLIPLQTLGTLEFRHMHGTADIQKITQWLNMVGCLFQYATVVPFKEVFGMISSINNVSNYEQFFHQVFGQYWQYSEEIHQKLESGVMCAKFALNGYDPLVVTPQPTVKKKSLEEANPLESRRREVVDEYTTDFLRTLPPILPTYFTQENLRPVLLTPEEETF